MNESKSNFQRALNFELMLMPQATVAKVTANKLGSFSLFITFQSNHPLFQFSSVCKLSVEPKNCL